MEKTRRRLLAVAFTAQGPEQAMAFSVATESARPPLGTAGILYIPKSVLFFFLINLWPHAELCHHVKQSRKSLAISLSS